MTDRIWHDMVEAGRLSRYHDRLATRFRRRYFATNVVISGLSLLAAAMLLVKVSAFVSASLFFAVSILVVWNSYSDYSKRATIARYVSRRCSQIAIEFRHIWYHEDTDGTIERIKFLEQELGIATDVELDIDDRLSDRTQEETDRVYQAEFGD